MLSVKVEAECGMIFPSNYFLDRLKSKKILNSDFQFQIYSGPLDQKAIVGV